MELQGFVKPVSEFYHSILLREGHIGTSITAFNFEDSFDWSSYKIALAGLPQFGVKESSEEYLVAYEIRKNLAFLAKNPHPCPIIDLGNVVSGKTPKDTAYAIGEITAQLQEAGIVVILLGSTSDLGLGNFLGCVSNKKQASMIQVDSHIQVLYDHESNADRLTLDELIFRHSEFLFNYTNLGYQTYFVSQKEKDLLDDLYFDAYRLGMVRANLKDFEPILRDAEIVNLSLNAIKYSDSPGSLIKSPNGFSGDEACQLSFYAGLSGKTIAFGVYDVEVETGREISCILASQMVWYFIEGIINQIPESPGNNAAEFTRFAVYMGQLSQEFIFYKSNKSNRWWQEVPVRDECRRVIACSLQDYEKALAQEIPDRWWKMFQKLN